MCPVYSGLTEKQELHLCPERGCGAAVMYSPQSLHRWGITHSESMERLAYSQGKLLELNILKLYRVYKL